MNIAILNWRDLAHPDSGGAEVFVHEVGRRWVESGHDVTLYSSSHRRLPPRGSDGELRIIRLGRLKTGGHHVLAPRAIRKAGRHDVVLESINTIPYMLPIRSDRFPPSVSLVHQLANDVWNAHLPGPLASAARRVEPILYRPYRRSSLVAVSESTRSDLVATGVQAVSVVPQGGIGPQPLRVKEEAPTIIFVGRLAANKRPDHALRAFEELKRRLPEVRLWMVGEGPMRHQLERSLPIGAELLGRIDREQLLERMGRAQLLLATSVREGWGLVVTEANALGTPAVAYDVPGLRDSIESGRTGLLCGPEPIEAASTMYQLLTSPDEYRVMRQNAVGWGGLHTWERTAQELLQFLVRAVASPPVDAS